MKISLPGIYYQSRLLSRIGFFSAFLFISIFNPNDSFSQDTDHWESIFYSNTIFSYYTSTEGIPDSNWRNLDFNDSQWRTGQGGIGYNDGDDATIIEACISVCLRKTFQIIDASIITEAVLHIDYDDAFVAYLNGVEIARSTGLSGDYPAYNQNSTSNHEASMYQGGNPESFLLEKEVIEGLLETGDNLLAIQVHNLSISSSDLSSNVFFSVGMANSQTSYLETPSWFSPPAPFWNSSLPIIILDTEGQAIINEPKITAKMKIIFNGEGTINTPDDSPNVYDGYIGIEVRGATSSNYPQKPYGLETRDSLGENLNLSLLGMPPENDWVLISHYNEKSFMRNMISLYLFEEMGHYSARMRLCQVILNGSYQGIYLFGEKIKRDKYRVDISEIYPWNNSGDSLTGGYLFKTEYNSGVKSWLSDYSPTDHPTHQTYFSYTYPKYDEISLEQKSYLKSAVDQFQQILQEPDFAEHYHNYIDIPSFIDYFLISELSRNIDGYKKSRYFHKTRDELGGLLNAGPVWDFDWAWKNIPSCLFQTTDCSGWAYKVNDCQNSPSPGWMVRLLQDPEFQDMVHCRWSQWRETILSENSINAFMDSIYNSVVDAQVTHFSRWPVLGVRTGAPEIESPSLTYDEEVGRLRAWIGKRIEWLDNNMPGFADNCPVSIETEGMEEAIVFRMFPNPASSDVYIESDKELKSISIYDFTGKLIFSEHAEGKFSWHLNIDYFVTGIYIVNARTVDGYEKTTKLIIE